MSQRIGTQIAGYRIDSLIARGGMGEVYLATQSFPERRVALKLLSSELVADPTFRERFIRESNAAASTEHPNIVPIYGAGEADGELYLAMRFIDGTDLRSVLERDGPLDPTRAIRICASVADALEAAHELGLVHRDVKPGNVLLDRRDHAYLADFGLIRRTRIETEITRTGQFMGTVDYVAPEQITGAELDGRADVYSLGCVLYECLIGSPPFRRDSEVATVYAHLEETTPAPSSKRVDVPRALDAVVATATAKRPDERFATAGEMARALRGAERASVEPPRATARRTILAAATAILAAVVAVVVVLSVRDEPASTTPPDGGMDGAPSIPLNSLVRLDPETGDVLATVPGVASLGPVLPRVEVGEGAIWIVSRDAITQVDPDDATLDTIVVGSAPYGASMAVGYRTVWLGAGPGIVRIDPIDLEQLRPIRLFPRGVSTDFPDVQVALGAASAWAVRGDGKLTRLDPVTAEPTGTVDVGASASGIDVGVEGVWVVDKLQETLVRVDPETLEIDEPIAIAGEPDNIAVGAGAVWLLDPEAGVVIPYDPASSSIGSPIRVGIGPSDIAVGLGAAWVANHTDGTISRIDPVTKTVDTVPIDAPVAAIAIDDSTQSLWAVIAVSRAL